MWFFQPRDSEERAVWGEGGCLGLGLCPVPHARPPASLLQRQHALPRHQGSHANCGYHTAWMIDVLIDMLLDR